MLNLLSIFQRNKINTIEVAWLLVNSMNIKIPYSTLKKEIEEHAFYPSLLSISEALTILGIKNITARFDVNKIPDIPSPFLVQMENGNANNSFSVVRQCNNNTVEYYDPKQKKWRIEDKNAFIEKCTGVVLIAEIDKVAEDKNYKNKIKKEKTILYFHYLILFILPTILIIGGIVGFINYGLSMVLPFIFSLLFLIGSYICMLLVWHDIDHSITSPLQSICASGKKINCNSVLSSRGSEFFGIKWSIIGFSYFTGCFIYLLITGLNNSVTLSILTGLSIGTLLYIPYSIFYQWRVAKNWCIFCLSVQAVLILTAVVGLIGEWYHFENIHFNDIISLVTSIIIPFIGCIIIYSIFKRSKENEQGKLEFTRLKHNPDIFKVILKEQKQISDNLDGLGIVLGNPFSANKIVKVCNPYCNPCSMAHGPLNELLDIGNDISLQIIFTASNDSNDRRALPVKHLLALYEKDNIDIKKPLDDWYSAEYKDYELFAAKYPLDYNLISRQSEKVETMKSWCDRTNISFTPTIFVNGYQIPKSYNIKDLRYFFLS